MPWEAQRGKNGCGIIFCFIFLVVARYPRNGPGLPTKLSSCCGTFDVGQCIISNHPMCIPRSRAASPLLVRQESMVFNRLDFEQLTVRITPYGCFQKYWYPKMDGL